MNWMNSSFLISSTILEQASKQRSRVFPETMSSRTESHADDAEAVDDENLVQHELLLRLSGYGGQPGVDVGGQRILLSDQRYGSVAMPDCRLRYA